MTSTFAWLDFDEASRQRMRDLVGLFEESGSIDELGLGRIRDAFSDRFFPGTSVLWRRARYLLFVPWIYQQMESAGYSHQTAERAARAAQKNLRNALRESNDTDGLIGMRQADPVAPPDSILWRGLELWGIRSAAAGSLSEYRSSLRGNPRAAQHDSEVATTGDVWDPRVPGAPEAFPKDASFALTPIEAEYLRDLVLAEDADAAANDPAARRSDSLLAVLVREQHVDLDVSAPWRHPHETASPNLRLGLWHAGCFSDVMQGARLAYVRRLADLRNDVEQRDTLDAAIADWSAGIQNGDGTPTARGKELHTWAADIRGFFAYVRALNPRVSPMDDLFVTAWVELALDSPLDVATSDGAVTLVGDRESQVKGGKARLTAAPEERRADGGAEPAPLTYRWGNGRQIARDILDGLAA